MSDEHTEIWRQHWDLQRERSEKMREAMKEYDRTVYYPALRALRARCATIGHKANPQIHFGIAGASWQYCNQCGEKINFESGD